MTIQQQVAFQVEGTLDAGHLRQVGKDASMISGSRSQRGNVEVSAEEDGASISIMVEGGRWRAIFVASQYQSTATQIEILPVPVSLERA